MSGRGTGEGYFTDFDLKHHKRKDVILPSTTLGLNISILSVLMICMCSKLQLKFIF